MKEGREHGGPKDCISLYRHLTDTCPAGAPEKGFLDQRVELAVRHCEVISRLGRFPARNAILHRQLTPEEIDFWRAHPEGY